MTQIEFNNQYPKIAGVDKDAILKHFTERLGSTNGEGYIGRYRNAVTIETRELSAYTIETPQGNVYVYQNANYKKLTPVAIENSRGATTNYRFEDIHQYSY